MSDEKVVAVVLGAVFVVAIAIMGLGTSSTDIKACGEACKGAVASVTWNKCSCSPVSP